MNSATAWYGEIICLAAAFLHSRTRSLATELNKPVFAPIFRGSLDVQYILNAAAEALKNGKGYKYAYICWRWRSVLKDYNDQLSESHKSK
jgi:hypothetical protein